jgi:hypothetical protein
MGTVSKSGCIKVILLITGFTLLRIAFISFLVYIFLAGYVLHGFNIFQNFMFNKGNDLIFMPEYAVIIFTPAIIVLFVSLNLEYRSNIPKSKHFRNTIITVIILIISLSFSVAPLFIHLRINHSGIYYTKLFQKERYYEWQELKSVSVYTKMQNNRALIPYMVLVFGENRVNVWNGHERRLLPAFDDLIKLIDLIDKNTDIVIEVNNFTEEMLFVLNESSDKDNIMRIFNYLNERRKKS